MLTVDIALPEVEELQKLVQDGAQIDMPVLERGCDSVQRLAKASLRRSQ